MAKSHLLKTYLINNPLIMYQLIERLILRETYWIKLLNLIWTILIKF